MFSLALVFIIIIVVVIVATYITNPFNKLSIIKLPLKVSSLDPPVILDNLSKINVRQNILWRYFAVIKCGIHILNTRYVHSPKSRSNKIDGIISDIRKLRFRPDKLLLISGDHFSALFVRNLGVFYYPTLDTQIKDSAAEWEDRQTIYLQTLAYALGVYKKHPIPSTTIVETGPFTATCINFYAYPSDTVYGLIYALSALLGEEKASPISYDKVQHKLVTQKIASDLKKNYKKTLVELYEHYKKMVLDESTGLIRLDIHLSGAKDITRRQSSFYDNVIYWKTTQLAMNLSFIPKDQKYLDKLKKLIIKTFWLSDEGYFLEDLSVEGKSDLYYSSDWLIVLATGFLDVSKSKEREYYSRSVEYIRENKIDRPFPIRYQQSTRAHRQFLAVRIAVASYGGDSIWSFWGMEYIKVQLLLYKNTKGISYLKLADKNIHIYEKLMLEYGGFPEVYDTNGELLQTPLYRSIRQTGWVIGFEQVRAIRASLN